MEILAQPLDWIRTDEENLAGFLATETGKRFLPRLAEAAPALLAGGDINAVLIRSGEVRGFSEALRTVLLMAHPGAPVIPAASAYPPLEDDAAWADGKKLDEAFP